MLESGGESRTATLVGMNGTPECCPGVTVRMALRRLDGAPTVECAA